MSTTLYPPIPAPTTDQEFLLAAGVKIHPSQYKTHDFSPHFLSIYARPTLTYHPWARLWHIPTSHILEAISPRYPSSSSNFLGFAAYKDRYLEFCLEVDSYFGWIGGGNKGKVGNGRGEGGIGKVKPIGRSEMEGAWIKVLVGMFEEMRMKRDVMRGFVGMRVGGGEGRILMTIREVDAEMKEVLRMAVEQRFGKEVEEYWARKWKIYGHRCPNLDVKCITDWSIEAPFQKSLLKPNDINNNDYDEDEDEDEDEDDDKNADESHGENNDSGVAMNYAESPQMQMQEPKNELMPENSNQTLNTKKEHEAGDAHRRLN
ncbi:hypothetical protein EAF04_002116 [Stromatinia cepivora]|nr:hypothetical protein EAF04_002116 [Stromatinia cepivora]